MVKGGAQKMTINPKYLTGKYGLSRMMSFRDTNYKDNFEYKPETLKNYGKIFSKSKIGKYSSKIKNICDNIYNDETKKVSEGIILIYSQYIDSGLIPVALALEEMGFTRFNHNQLFKDKPSDLVDVRTMNPPINKLDFKPARYTMITGNIKLSPHNDIDVKSITEQSNKNGENVKVYLISKAGAEGIDFKFIRQVHILDPWYNMNRIEQIIGRAVRNLSHKDLPFEKRNVEIFMHATILNNNVEEAADLYVYRVAEYKAIQIGKVTRVLKECSIDCIINHNQTKFTQKIMNENLKEPITQELSSGKIIHNFKIGDAPFSPSCDYMATCDYKCNPDVKIDESKLNEDTYDEKFIIINSEKILQRIRMLFKEAFFYKKERFFKFIQTPKKYPYVQIFSALTQLIEDENEFIIDKYGRNGRLINIGEYYLFQPIELTNKNISIYDRSVPLDFKNDVINFKLNPTIKKPSVNKKQNILIRSESNESEKITEELNKEGKLIVDEMNVNLNMSNEFYKKNKINRGDDNWFKHSGIVMKMMSLDKDTYLNINQYLFNFVVEHMIELLLFKDKLNLMNYIYSLKVINPKTIESSIKTYFEKNSITSNKLTCYFAYDLNKRIILILNSNNKWINTTPVQQIEIASLNETKVFLSFNINNCNELVGFFGYDKGYKKLSFKTKNMKSIRDTGAICEQKKKQLNMEMFNELIGEEKYTTENTKVLKDEKGNTIEEAVGNIELCILTEFVLRYFNEINKNNKKWFFTPEMAIYHNFYKIYNVNKK